MFTFQIATILIMVIIFSGLIVKLFRKFGNQLFFGFYIIIPLIVFSLGFIFRLSGNKVAVDLGFFLTEFSQMFISAVFAACLVLGQVKYWKK